MKFRRPLSWCQRVLLYRIEDAFDSTFTTFSDDDFDLRNQFLAEVELAVDSVDAPDSLYHYELEHLYDDLLSERGCSCI